MVRCSQLCQGCTVYWLAKGKQLHLAGEGARGAPGVLPSSYL